MKGNVVKLMDNALDAIAQGAQQNARPQTISFRAEAMACVIDITKLRRIMGSNVSVGTHDRYDCKAWTVTNEQVVFERPCNAR